MGKTFREITDVVLSDYVGTRSNSQLNMRNYGKGGTVHANLPAKGSAEICMFQCCCQKNGAANPRP